jgi:predicted O-linked N-acetylglucosamine transferase (SPINDLY family)
MLDFLDKESQSEFQIILDLFNEKNIQDSELRLKKLILKYPNKFLLENFLGVIFSNQNKYQDALLAFKKAVDLNPDFVEGYYNVGTVLKKINQFQEAIKYFNLAININKNYFEVYFNLADCYKNINKFKDAEECFLKCIYLKKDDIEVYNNLGLLYLEDSKLDLAEKNFQKCLELDSDYFYAYNNLGSIFFKLGDYEKAIIYFNKAIKVNIGFALPYNNLGKIFKKQNKKSLAIEFFRKAIDLDNKFYDAYLDLIQTLKDDFKHYDVVDLSEKILNLNSKDSPCIIANCISVVAECYVVIGEFEKGFIMYENAIRIYKDNPIIFKNYILQYNYNPNFNLEKYFEIINQYIGTLKIIDKQYLNDFTYIKNPQKIKIGFVSGDFKEQAVGFQIFGIIKELFERKEFELFAYYNDDTQDSLNIKFRSIFDSWNNIKDLKDIDLINKIRADGIHILVDLSGYSAKNRLEIFFQKSAPVQVAWAGYLASTGLKQMDYIITDPYVIGEKSQFIEKISQQDHIWSNLSCAEDVTVLKNIPATTNGYVTFGSFNNLIKVNPDLINVWSEILYQVKNSRLYLKNSNFRNEKIKKNYQELFLKNNIKLEQLIFEIDSDRKTLFEDYNKIDIALDTFPYTGGTTSLEASWMCVPILTRSGDTFLSRCGESINVNLGLKDWICKSSDEYIKKAINFSADLRKLQLTKDTLIFNRNNNVLFNSKKFAENLSVSFKKMWKAFNV